MIHPSTMLDERVRGYEQSSWLDVAGHTLRPGGLALTDHALDLCALPNGARVLDVGCRSAASVEHLIARQHLNAIGLDPSWQLLQAGRRRNSTRPLLQAYGQCLSIADNQLDALLTECSLSVMEEFDRALAEFWRVLRAGGYVVLSDIYARNPDDLAAIRQLPIDSCLSGARSQAEIIDWVQACGFTRLQWEDHTRALNQFAAQLIWSNGSHQRFWSRATSQTAALDVQTAIAQAKPGYYLLIAQKPS